MLPSGLPTVDVKLVVPDLFVFIPVRMLILPAPTARTRRVTSHLGSFNVHFRVKKQQPKYARQCGAAPYNFSLSVLSYGLGLALIGYM